MATSARSHARHLQNLTYPERQAILFAIADELQSQKEALLQANKLDLENAAKDGTSDVLVKRLKLTEDKLKTLSDGIRQIASQADPLNVIKCRRELASGLILSQITVPIGVLMIIFESRPDSFPQIAALAIASGNGLLLKGGKEAKYSNEAIYRVVGDAIERGSGGKVGREIVALVTSRGQVSNVDFRWWLSLF
jgi:gamma-glutamyl phosphate reductase